MTCLSRGLNWSVLNRENGTLLWLHWCRFRICVFEPYLHPSWPIVDHYIMRFNWGVSTIPELHQGPQKTTSPHRSGSAALFVRGRSRWRMAGHGRWHPGVHLAHAQLYSELVGSRMRRRGWGVVWGQLGDLGVSRESLPTNIGYPRSSGFKIGSVHFLGPMWEIYDILYDILYKGPCHKTDASLMICVEGPVEIRSWICFLNHVQYLKTWDQISVCFFKQTHIESDAGLFDNWI